MTREEAIKAIKSHCYFANLVPVGKEALDMAIKALEQEPCEDCISRNTVLTLINDVKNANGFSEYSQYEYLFDQVDAMPSVIPQEPTAKENLVVEDCISRAELLKAVDTWDKFGCDADTKLVPVKDCYVPYIHYDDVVKAIKGMPSIQPKAKVGHWIGHREHCESLGVRPSGLYAYEWCSNCDCGIDVKEWHRNNYNYCPDCGCRMVESQESEDKE